MKRIALFLVLITTLASAAMAEQFGAGESARVFVSVQLNDGQSSLPISSLTIADGSTGTVYVENNLPYIEQMEKSRRMKYGDAGMPSDSEDGLTMLLTPTLRADGKIDIEFSIRKSEQMGTNVDVTQMAETEVRHKIVVRSGEHSTIQLDSAPGQNESLSDAESGAGYTVTLVAHKI